MSHEYPVAYGDARTDERVALYLAQIAYDHTRLYLYERAYKRIPNLALINIDPFRKRYTGVLVALDGFNHALGIHPHKGNEISLCTG
jgi:hypothetical protein